MSTRGGFVTVRLTSRWPYNPISLAVGVLSGSRQFSHAIAIIGDRAYEASMTHGCRACSVAEVMEGIAVYRDMPVWSRTWMRRSRSPRRKPARDTTGPAPSVFR